MKRLILYITILLLPFLTLIVINESIRLSLKENGLSTIHTKEKKSKNCTWACHNDTVYCKRNHSHILKNHFEKTDSLYFGVIKALKNTGNYGFANIILFVILIPLVIFILFISSLEIEFKIRKIKNG